MDISNRTVIVDGLEIKYCLERKPVKNLNLRIKNDCRVIVSANENVPVEELDEFVCRKSSYIMKAIARFQEDSQFKHHSKQYVSGETFNILGRGLRLKVSKAQEDSVFVDGVYIFLEVRDPDNFEQKKRVIEKFLNQQCQSVFSDIMDELYPMFKKYGVEKPLLRIRSMQTRWGSCMVNKNTITLNKHLIEAPRHCIEYVVMHELCHFVHPNHSKQFYAFLSVLMPDWRDRKKVLEQGAVYWF